ncbi:NADH-quinone oxidoreductase subunit C [Paenibacillus sp. UNCCL117]|uniref:NADH-quinone oxidoreductase subunit C n=1 Tax=unclassified Paenibacillus TaxID=185978 RepID=UPI00088B6F14|nr:MULTISPECIES: NADH-quinone oxidoreductase subunit C [unclassified Paenibacillus]SDE34046.1 NADH-quinone oxidoreductase subunit C [Paenibacillus sp. cl123]SFW64169.1 NADH-quinone oxidoreductase subunit C [Paenibacillus sp. UNCCL117]
MTDDSKLDKTAGGPAPDDKPAADNKPAADAPSTEVKEASATPEAEKAPSAKPAAGEEGAAPAPARAALTDEEKEAKAKAAAEARAARAKERAAKAEAEAADTPKEPSPNQPLLDRLVALLQEIPGEPVQEAFINEKGGHLPCLSIKPETWPATAEMLRTHPELRLNYLRNVSGTDMETHMEVVYHLISLETKREYCVKVKTSRETPSVPSVTSVWPTANWNEREIYDLLGIDFPGHPDLRRIMMADDWVGHPLRKDYEPLDPEV